jgi:ATP-dependent helicase HrpA
MARSSSGRARSGDRSGPAERRARRRELRAEAYAALVDRGGIRYDEALPITSWRDELIAAVGEHQVVVVAGDTGSGKSTQLPKLCLEAGRGVAGMIGHTQPRRVAARTVAERIAEELGVEVGAEVGYSVRFTDRAGDRTLVRLMTDGILLAELQHDRRLRRYDTLIVDEAHERSLNIDFLLGYLRRLLPDRPDLKVVVTSATIDTERFAAHFGRDGRPAPIVEVTGRTYPVEVRYRPFGEEPGDDRDQVQAILDAVDELREEGPGDVLVFLSGEREIHDAADALRALELPGTEVLPLYARLSSREQHRVFQPHRTRRIVLSTNVAETSVTVPGVRYVVDAGTARISRYSRRLKVQRLPIEAVSRASADQRAGRCGRVAPGVCIRLYSEEDYLARPEYTEPEVLRTNLASVILQMTAIGLGDVAAFPFVEPPASADIRDGYLLLDELAAIGPPEDGTRPLTAVGRQLARLPVDPRLGRMVVEAHRRGCLREVLVIAAGLSIQDPREHPADQLDQARQLHRRFDVEGSDLLSMVALWDHLRERQGALSGNQFRRLCRAEHLNYLRVREWQDLYSQLRQVAGEIGMRAGAAGSHPSDAGDGASGSHPDHVHQAVMAGLLSHLGRRDPDRREYRGARNARFSIARGSVLWSRQPPWVMAAELVETNRLWARRVAVVKPHWAEELGAHLVKRSYGEPRWDERSGRAVTSETVTLYGLPVVQGRTVGYDRVDPTLAREWFIRHALVDGEWRTRHRFVERNRAALERARRWEARSRRPGVVDASALYDFYDERIGPGVVSGGHFDRWWKRARSDDPDLLDLGDELVASLAGVDEVAYPDAWRHEELRLPITYETDPSNPIDGATVHVPLEVLHRLDGAPFDWHVPGHRAELVAALAATLPKQVRRELIPLAETAERAHRRLGEPGGPLVEALAAALTEESGVGVDPRWFRPTDLPTHLRLHFAVAAPSGEVLEVGDDLAELQRRLAGAARAVVAAAAPMQERRGMTTWQVGELARQVEVRRRGMTVRGHPALVDDGDSVSLRVLTSEASQERAMRGGVRRLLLLTAAPSASSVASTLGRDARLAVVRSGERLDALAADCVSAATDHLLVAGGLPWDEAAFSRRQREVRAEAPGVARQALAQAAEALGGAVRIRDRLDALTTRATADSRADAAAHLERLVGPGFVVRAGVRRLPDVVRYVTGLEYRVERLGADVARDRRRIEEVRAVERRYTSLLAALGDGPVAPELVDLGWQLEELRLSVFAQAVGAKGPVSAKRLLAAIDAYR